jgi:hypothetical protein
MKFRNSLGGIVKLRCQKPRGLFSSSFVTGPSDFIKKLAKSLAFIDLGVENLYNLILKFTVNFDRRRRRLDPVWNCVWRMRFQHRNMINWVDSTHAVRKFKDPGVRSSLTNNRIRPIILLREFLQWSVGANVFA